MIKKIIVILLVISSLITIAQKDRTYGYIENAIKNPTEVYKLALKFKDFKDFPKEILQFTNLEELEISSCKLTSIPESINKLTNLKILTLKFNNFTEFPVAIFSIKSLIKLDFSADKITSIPEGIENLTNIEDLNLGHSKIISLHKSIGNLKQLKRLDLAANEITSLPESIGNLTNLVYLNVGFNKLTSLPNSIGNLSNLEELELGSNSIESIPETIGNLNSLKVIDLKFNRLVSLPDGICKLQNIEYIRISSNKLESTPECLKNLETLKGIDLSNNDLSIVPVAFSQMPNLEYSLDGNYNIPDTNNYAEESPSEEVVEEDVVEEGGEVNNKIDYLLTYEYLEFVEPETYLFDVEEASSKLPWKTNDIYNFLKGYKEILYNVEKLNLKSGEVEETNSIGIRIKAENNEISLVMYDYSQKIELGHFNPTFSENDTNTTSMFLPFMPLDFYRVLDDEETINVEEKSYKCTLVEGFLYGKKWKYWMLTEQAGAYVRIIRETSVYRFTWNIVSIE